MKVSVNFLKPANLLRYVALALLLNVISVAQAAGNMVAQLGLKSCTAQGLLCWVEYPSTSHTVSDDLSSRLNAVNVTATDTMAEQEDCLTQSKPSGAHHNTRLQSGTASQNPMLQRVSFSEAAKPLLNSAASETAKECLTNPISFSTATWILAFALIGFVSLSNKRRV